jgi:ribosomal-protein-alanine N-acetyltransferase
MLDCTFKPFPLLSTKRFDLRQITLADDNEIFALRSNEKVIQYLDRPPVETIEEVHEFINKIINGIERDEWIHWVITEKSDDKLIGTICLWNLDREKEVAEIGFELLPDYMGKGIMQKVVPIIIDYGFKKMKLKSIEGEVDPGNVKSIKLMERFGFTHNRDLEKTIVYSLSNDK